MRIAVVQIDQDVYDRTAVLDKALTAIEHAAAQGVEFLLFPELFSTGYIPNFELWDRLGSGAEFVDALQGAAREHALHIGTGHAELVGGDILNTYLVIDTEGAIIGRSVKENAESYIFRRGKQDNLVRTSFGPVSIAICVDNHLTRTLHRVKQSQPVLHLMPHAWPAPYRKGVLVSPDDIDRAAREFAEFPVRVARFLQVPTVFVNQLGDLPPMTGLYRFLMSPESFALRGGSKILDRHGHVLGELGQEEGMIIAEVPLADPAEQVESKAFPGGIGRISPAGAADLADYGGWIHPGPKIVRNILTPLENWRGQRAYRRRLARRHLYPLR